MPINMYVAQGIYLTEVGEFTEFFQNLTANTYVYPVIIQGVTQETFYDLLLSTGYRL
jgi:hypothetical protein